MDATTLVIDTLIHVLGARLHTHLVVRNMSLRNISLKSVNNKTRKYQHFQVICTLHLGVGHPFGDETYRLELECYYNTSNNLALFVKLGEDDPFKGAADFDPIIGQVRHQFEDIVRSFADVRPHSKLAVFNI